MLLCNKPHSTLNAAVCCPMVLINQSINQSNIIVYYTRRQQNHTDKTPKTQNYTTVYK